MITDNERVTLPIGIEVDGVRYREVVIDEMTGVDEENLASRKVRNNGAKAISLLLRRCIQSIEGVLPQKSNPLLMIDEKWVRNMYVADRDYLVLCIRALSGNSEVLTDSECTSCGHENAAIVDLKELDVYEWDENSPVEIRVDLPRGFYNKESGQYHKEVTWAFPKGTAQEKIASLPEHQVGTMLIATGIKQVQGLEVIPHPDEIRKLSVRDRNAFAQAIMENTVGVDTAVDLTCESCGHEYQVEVNTVGFSSSGQPQTPKQSNSGTSGRRLRKRR